MIRSAQARGVAGVRQERGGALVEFALVSFVLYLLLAGAVDFGRLMFDANALQDVARLAARELAIAPLPAASSFDAALLSPNVQQRVFNPACLVVDLDDPVVAADREGFFGSMPVVNRALRTLMISEPSRPNILRYAGALLTDGSNSSCGGAAPTGFTVGIPLVDARDGAGVETISWVPVLEEIANANCPSSGPFSLIPDPACGPVQDRGLVAVRVNYPYQAAMLSGFRSSLPTADDPLPPNVSNPIVADDGSVQQNNAAPGGPVDDGAQVGTYAGPYGLGRQFALAGKTVRPFRKVVSAQAIYRREVFQ